MADSEGTDRSASRRVLFTRIAERASDADVRRAERLLLRGIERQWPDTRIERLLQGMLLRLVLDGGRGATP